METAIAFIVKSLLNKSSFMVPGLTSGYAAGALYDSLLAVTTSILIPSKSIVAVPNGL